MPRLAACHLSPGPGHLRHDRLTGRVLWVPAACGAARSSAPFRVAVAAAAVLGADGCTSSSSSAAPRSLRFFTSHEAAVVEAATARIAPGPADDPAEAGAPGSPRGRRDRLHRLDAGRARRSRRGRFSADDLRGRAVEQPAHVRARPHGAVHRAGSGRAHRVAAAPEGWQQQYRQGIATLDKLAGGDFTKASHAKQDKILTMPAASRSRRCCSSTRSRACTPPRNTAATGTWRAGRTSATRATSSPADTPPRRSRGRTGTIRSTRPRWWPTC